MFIYIAEADCHFAIIIKKNFFKKLIITLAHKKIGTKGCLFSLGNKTWGVGEGVAEKASQTNVG